jgi:hypothetical protein
MTLKIAAIPRQLGVVRYETINRAVQIVAIPSIHGSHSVEGAGNKLDLVNATFARERCHAHLDMTSITVL